MARRGNRMEQESFNAKDEDEMHKTYMRRALELVTIPNAPCSSNVRKLIDILGGDGAKIQ